MAKTEEQKGEKSQEKPHVCSMCARPSDSVICPRCEAKVRGEVLEHHKDVNKAGRTDTGRR
jgi:predicted amidophosphoribosyltransferase